jgi:hypothetical protein
MLADWLGVARRHPRGIPQAGPAQVRVLPSPHRGSLANTCSSPCRGPAEQRPTSLLDISGQRASARGNRHHVAVKPTDRGEVMADLLPGGVRSDVTKQRRGFHSRPVRPGQAEVADGVPGGALELEHGQVAGDHRRRNSPRSGPASNQTLGACSGSDEPRGVWLLGWSWGGVADGRLPLGGLGDGCATAFHHGRGGSCWQASASWRAEGDCRAAAEVSIQGGTSS